MDADCRSAITEFEHGPRRLRVVALYSLEMRTSSHRRESAAGGVPVFELFPESPRLASYRSLLLAAQEQLPLVTGVAQHAPEDVPLPSSAELLRVLRVCSWTFDMRVAGFVLALALDVERLPGRSLEEVQYALFDDLDTGRSALRVDGKPLEALHPSPESVSRLGFDFHAIVQLLDPEAAPITRATARPLVSRRWHVSKPDFVTAGDVGEDPPPDGMLAVTPGATLISDIADDAGAAMLLCAAQAIASFALLRSLQDESFRATVLARDLESLETDETRLAFAERLDRTSEQLAALQLDLSLGVERFDEMRIFLPVWRVEQYHKALTRRLGVQNATAVTGTMLQRAALAVAARKATLDAERDRRLERRRRWLSAVGGAVAFVGIVLSLILSFLGMSVEPVGSDGSAFRGALVPYYLALSGVVAVAAIGGAAWARSGEKHGSPDSRRPSH